MLDLLSELFHSLGRRADSSSSTGSVHAKLADLKANPGSVVNSIQRGSIALTLATSATATITSVNTAKAVEINCGAEVTAPTGAGERSAPSLELTNATTVTARVGETTTATIRYVVLEYK